MSTSVADIAKGEKAENPVAKFSNFLDRFKPQLALALPKHLNADRLARLAVTEFSKNPTLQKCEPASIVACVLAGAQLGLEIGVNGQAYMVPYYDKRRGRHIATFVPGWRGLIDLVNRAGRASAWTGAVYEGDEFDYALGDRPFVKHRPSDSDEKDRRLLYVYAVGRVKGSDWPNIEVWPIAKVWRHRDSFNKVGEQHYSYQHPEQYARKVVLLQVLKYLPQSIELSRALAAEATADSGETIDGDFATVFDGHVDAETGEITGARAITAGNATDATPRESVKPKSYAVLADAIQRADTRGAAELLIDEAAEYLPADQLADLRKLAETKRGAK